MTVEDLKWDVPNATPDIWHIHVNEGWVQNTATVEDSAFGVARMLWSLVAPELLGKIRCLEIPLLTTTISPVFSMTCCKWLIQKEI